ncbi:hypothetical protein BDW75DRAFT_117004 [Aspergillus navahoensis]
MPDTKSSDPRDPSVSDSASASSSPSHSANSTSKTQTKIQTQSGTQSSLLYPGLGANFAHDPKAPFTVNYDQEVYLQFMAGEESAGTGTPDANKNKKKNKTLNQIYRERRGVCLPYLKEWVRRALNPAISDPRGDPSPIDFECAESQRVRERF